MDSWKTLILGIPKWEGETALIGLPLVPPGCPEATGLRAAAPHTAFLCHQDVVLLVGHRRVKDVFCVRRYQVFI